MFFLNDTASRISKCKWSFWYKYHVPLFIHLLKENVYCCLWGRWGEVNWCFTPFFQPCLFIYDVSFHSWRNNFSWEWTSNLPLATDNYLSWASNPSGEERIVSKRDALTTRPRRPPCLAVRTYLWVCVCVVWLVFYVAFINLSVTSRWWLLVAWDAIGAQVLSAANTDALCRRHKAWIHHPVTLSWHQANQSWFYPLNAERLARKQPVPIFTPLVWCGRDSNPRPPDYEANALSTAPVLP